MFNLIPLVLILLSLSVIIIIVARKFSVLANLDVDSIPAEREAKVKEQIISSRLKRNFYRHFSRLSRLVMPIAGGIRRGGKWAYQKLVDYKESYKEEKQAESPTPETAPKLMTEAEEAVRAEDYDTAEKKFIDLISLEPKNIKAFRGLGRLYHERKDYHEALQTWDHILRLLDKDHAQLADRADDQSRTRLKEIDIMLGSTFHEMSLTQKAMEEYEEALKTIKKALKLESNNPRYLDTKLEISIIMKDRVEALDAYEKMAKVNPDNQKLEDIKKQINEL